MFLDIWGWKNSKIDKHFQKAWKIVKNSIKLRVLAIRCSHGWSVDQWGDGGTKYQKRQKKKSVNRKIALKKTDRTNIIATDFVWEQLNYNKCHNNL